MKTYFLPILLAVNSTLMTHSCTRSSNEVSSTRVNITLPKKIANLSTLATSTESHWGMAAPTNLETLDCYAIAVTAADLGQSQCAVTGQVEPFMISRLYGQYSQGSSIELDVPNGSGRNFSILGFHSTNGSCQNTLDTTFNSKNFSNPIVIGSKSADLTGSETTVSITVSLNEAKVLDRCQGPAAFSNLPNQYWPPAHCTPTINQITGNGATLNIQGSCLAGVQNLSLRNQTLNSNTQLELTSKTDTSIAATLLANFQMRLDQTLQILLQTAHGQIPAPFVLTLGPNSVPLSAIDTSGASNGQVLKYNSGSGQVEWGSSAGGSSSGFGFKLFSNGSLVGEIKDANISNSSSLSNVIINSNLVYKYFKLDMMAFDPLQPAYFLSSIYAVPNNVSAVPLKDLLFFGGSVNDVSFHFTGANCTGDLVYPSSENSPSFIGNIFAYPTGCTSTSNANDTTCTGLTYKSLTSLIPTFNPSINVESSIQTQYGYSGNPPTNPSPDSNHIVCVNNFAPHSMSGYVFPEASVGAGVSPAHPMIENLTLSR